MKVVLVLITILLALIARPILAEKDDPFADVLPLKFGTKLADVSKAFPDCAYNWKRNAIGGRSCQFLKDGRNMTFVGNAQGELVATEDWPKNLPDNYRKILASHHKQGSLPLKSKIAKDLFAEYLRYDLCPKEKIAMFETQNLYILACLAKPGKKSYPLVKAFDRAFWDSYQTKDAEAKKAESKHLRLVEMSDYSACTSGAGGKSPYGTYVGEMFQRASDPMGLTLYACVKGKEVLFNPENLIDMDHFAATRAFVKERCKSSDTFEIKRLWPNHDEAFAKVSCKKVLSLLK